MWIEPGHKISYKRFLPKNGEGSLLRVCWISHSQLYKQRTQKIRKIQALFAFPFVSHFPLITLSPAPAPAFPALCDKTVHRALRWELKTNKLFLFYCYTSFKNSNILKIEMNMIFLSIFCMLYCSTSISNWFYILLNQETSRKAGPFPEKIGNKNIKKI